VFDWVEENSFKAPGRDKFDAPKEAENQEFLNKNHS